MKWQTNNFEKNTDRQTYEQQWKKIREEKLLFDVMHTRRWCFAFFLLVWLCEYVKEGTSFVSLVLNVNNMEFLYSFGRVRLFLFGKRVTIVSNGKMCVCFFRCLNFFTYEWGIFGIQIHYLLRRRCKYCHYYHYHLTCRKMAHWKKWKTIRRDRKNWWLTEIYL